MIWAVTKYAFCRRAGTLDILVGTSSSGWRNLPPRTPPPLRPIEKRVQKLGGDWGPVPTFLYVPVACFEVVAKRAHKGASIPFWELAGPFEVRFFESLQKDHLQLHLGKVYVFWESHKCLRNLHRRFVLCSNGQIHGGDFAKFCGLLKIYELYVREWPIH